MCNENNVCTANINMWKIIVMKMCNSNNNNV